MVGVKAELGTPDPSQPNSGRLEFFVDWYVILILNFLCVLQCFVCVHAPCSSALASPEFEGRGGEELGQHLAYQLSQAYSHHSTIDRKKLCIIPGQQCWILYVDVLVSGVLGFVGVLAASSVVGAGVEW